MKQVKITYRPRNADERLYVNHLMFDVAGGYSDDSGTMISDGKIGQVDLSWFLLDLEDAVDLAMRLSEFKPIARYLKITVETVES